MHTGHRAVFSIRLSMLALAIAGAAALGQPPKGDPKPAEAPKAETKAAKDFSISDGYYVEACSCGAPCPCELVGPDMKCKGVGAYHLTSAKYDGEDLSGVEIAYALYIGKTVNVYIDAPAKQRGAAEKFARAALAGFGPIKSVKDGKIEINGKDGAYKVSVDDGKIMSFETKPVLGGDKKTPLVHSNTQDALNPTMYQGTCVSAKYSDGETKVELDEGRNSYFNQHMKSSGKI